MAWMTYVSHWFEQDDWYEGLQRVRYIYVVITIFCEGFYFLLAFLLLELCFMPYIFGHSVIQDSENMVAV